MGTLGSVTVIWELVTAEARNALEQRLGCRKARAGWPLLGARVGVGLRWGWGRPAVTAVVTLRRKTLSVGQEGQSRPGDQRLPREPFGEVHTPEGTVAQGRSAGGSGPSEMSPEGWSLEHTLGAMLSLSKFKAEGAAEGWSGAWEGGRERAVGPDSVCQMVEDLDLAAEPGRGQRLVRGLAPRGPAGPAPRAGVRGGAPGDDTQHRAGTVLRSVTQTGGPGPGLASLSSGGGNPRWRPVLDGLALGFCARQACDSLWGRISVCLGSVPVRGPGVVSVRSGSPTLTDSAPPVSVWTPRALLGYEMCFLRIFSSEVCGLSVHVFHKGFLMSRRS